MSRVHFVKLEMLEVLFAVLGIDDEMFAFGLQPACVRRRDEQDRDQGCDPEPHWQIPRGRDPRRGIQRLLIAGRLPN